MKKTITIALAILFSGLSAWSQSIESIKTFALLGQIDKAKAEIDKAATNQKIMAKAEAYILKTAIYASLSMSDENRAKPTGNALVEEAHNAFEKYKSMEPDLKKLNEEDLYKNGPINIYYNYYNQGLADYNAKNWETAIPKLEKAINYSDFLIGKSLLNFPVDTNLLILTGFVAERANNNGVAAMAYKRLADAQVSGADFESIYQFLVRYYYTGKDMENFEKTKALGAKLYPGSEFFTYDKLDFAVGLVETFSEKMGAVNAYIASDPESYKAHEFRWTFLYDTIFGIQDGDPTPSELAKWEADMVASLKKCAQMTPEEVKNHQYLGNYYVIKKDAANDARAKFAQELQQKTKPGTKASAADIAKREQLDKEFLSFQDLIIEPYTNAANLYSKVSNIEPRDHQQYKNVVGYLVEIYETKKKRAAKDPIISAKWAAEEKKWTDVYEYLSKNGPKRTYDCADVKVGMTQNEVVSIMGKPESVSSTTTEAGKEELLFYKKCTINISKDGKVYYINERKN